VLAYAVIVFNDGFGEFGEFLNYFFLFLEEPLTSHIEKAYAF